MTPLGHLLSTRTQSEVSFFRPNILSLLCLQFCQYNKERHRSKGIRDEFRRVRREGKESVHSEKSSRQYMRLCGWAGSDLYENIR